MHKNINYSPTQQTSPSSEIQHLKAMGLDKNSAQEVATFRNRNIFNGNTLDKSKLGYIERIVNFFTGYVDLAFRRHITDLMFKDLEDNSNNFQLPTQLKTLNQRSTSPLNQEITLNTIQAAIEEIPMEERTAFLTSPDGNQFKKHFMEKTLAPFQRESFVNAYIDFKLHLMCQEQGIAFNDFVINSKTDAFDEAFPQGIDANEPLAQLFNTETLTIIKKHIRELPAE